MEDLSAPKIPTPAAPDIAVQSRPKVAGRLDWVGMEKVATPVRFCLPTGETVLVPSLVDVGVSLDQAQARGIHMSRLFATVQEHLMQDGLTLGGLKILLLELLKGQDGLSQSGRLSVSLELPLQQSALVSGKQGWRQYPVAFEVEGSSEKVECRIKVEVLYSSTCPCSAALAESSFRDEFMQQFGHRPTLTPLEFEHWLVENGWVATPHAQRSRAEVTVQVANSEFAPEVWQIIESIENALGTPVQAAVKRVDEQEFARRNAENLMFCEDAARIIKAELEKDGRFSDFWLTVEHQESLHAHNAVARARKS